MAATIVFGDVVFRSMALSANAFIKALPRGAYTTARTCDHGRAVFEFTHHVNRMANSVALMVAAGSKVNEAGARADAGGGGAAGTPAGTTVSPDVVRGAMAAAIAAAVKHHWQWQPATGRDGSSVGTSPELKVSCLLTWSPDQVAASASLMAAWLAAAGAEAHSARIVTDGGGAFKSLVYDDGDDALASASARLTALGAGEPWILCTHVTALPPRRPPPIKVEIHGAPRANATAKDSEWVRQRASLEASKPADVEEVLLCDRDVAGGGAVLEGTQTNLFVLDEDGTLVTAGEGVLEGTVRRVVLEVAAKMGLRVSLTPPRMADVTRWSAALLTSTSRLVLPVHEVRWQGVDDGMWHVRTMPPIPPVISALEREVAAVVAAHSETLVPADEEGAGAART